MSHSQKDLYKKLLGISGENAACKLLKSYGYRITARNFKTPFGEVDILARQGETLVLIEVKTRTGDRYGAPKEAVGKSKQLRYKRIAQFYGLQTGEEPNARFDVAEVFADGRIEYYENAF